MKTDKTKALPHFFTQVIGSLPRPLMVLDLLSSRYTLSADEFTRQMDEMVVFAIRLQEQAGLDVVSDGEWRREHYIGEFLKRIGGFERARKYKHQGEEKLTDVVVKPISPSEPVFERDAEFLRSHTERVAKFALPSPFLIATRYWHEDYSTDAYPTRENFIERLAEIIRLEAEALVSAGIDIVQLDDPALTYFCDQNVMRGNTHDERLLQRWDIDAQLPVAVDAINHIAEGLEAEVHLHCCHSVYKRQSDVTGDYKPILPRLSNARIDRLNLEFAYTGTGDVSDLLLLPDHLSVGMGVVDVRTETPQSIEEIESIAAAGAEAIDQGRIALNPDCGFAPDAGEPPTIDEAYIKLKRMCEASRRIRKRFST